MAKKVIANTGIKHIFDGQDYLVLAGEVVDTSKFSKEQLEQLYDAGAVTIEETKDVEIESSTPKKAVPAKAATPEVKSSGPGNAA